MKQRRNPFETTTAPAAALPTAPLPIYDNLRVAEARKRDRTWELRTYAGKVVYRNVNPHLALRVKELAGDLQVREGEVARRLLEYAMQAYAEGELNLTPRPHPDRFRMTLFPEETSDERRARGGMPRKEKRLQEPKWKVLTSWRGFPERLKREISALASENGLDVPVGELVSALLRFGLKAHEYGLLKLEPVERIGGYTLAESAGD
jgi:hypothetical protein